MKYDFERMLADFLRPLSELGGRPLDSLYFLRRDGSFVFTEGYCHPPGGVYGKIIYYPCPGGGVDVFGREYGCITKKKVDGELVYVGHPEQIRMHGEIDPGLDPGVARPVFVEYEMPFRMDEFVGFFDPHHSLLACARMYPWVDRAARAASEVLEVPWERLGLTGSLAYGRYEEGDDDLDLVIRGSVADNLRAYRTIRSLSSLPDRMVMEFGRWWPMRFYEQDVLICPFFTYQDLAEAPLADFTLEVVEEDVEVEGEIADDTHTLYMPPFLKLDEVKIAGVASAPLRLIIYDGALRGEFFRGDLVRCRSRLVRVRTAAGEDFPAALVTLWDNIVRVGEKA